jgi:hypothetical protein
MDPLDLILDAQKETNNSLKELVTKVANIDKATVGQERCLGFRNGLQLQLNEHDQRIRGTEAVCQTFTATREHTVDGVELQAAKDSAIRSSSENFECEFSEFKKEFLDLIKAQNAKFRAIDEKLKTWDFVKLTWHTVNNNSVLRPFVLAVGGIFVMIAWQRIRDLILIYGTHVVAAGLGILFLTILFAWIAKRNNLDEVKKIMGWQ